VIFVKESFLNESNQNTKIQLAENTDVYLFNVCNSNDGKLISYNDNLDSEQFLDMILASLDAKKEVYIVKDIKSFNDLNTKTMSRHHFFNEKEKWLYLCASIRNKLKTIQLQVLDYSTLESSIIKHLS